MDKHTRAHAHTHTHTHARAHTCTRVHTCTRAHTYLVVAVLPPALWDIPPPPSLLVAAAALPQHRDVHTVHQEDEEDRHRERRVRAHLRALQVRLQSEVIHDQQRLDGGEAEEVEVGGPLPWRYGALVIPGEGEEERRGGGTERRRNGEEEERRGGGTERRRTETVGATYMRTRTAVLQHIIAVFIIIHIIGYTIHHVACTRHTGYDTSNNAQVILSHTGRGRANRANRSSSLSLSSVSFPLPFPLPFTLPFPLPTYGTRR